MSKKQFCVTDFKYCYCIIFIFSLFFLGKVAFAQIKETKPEYSEFEFLQQQIRHNPPKLDVPQNLKLVPKWQKTASKRLRELLRIDSSKPVPLNAMGIVWNE